MLTLLLFLLVIGVLVFVHEAGHFVAAKLSGIQVDEFALGFGPKIVGFKKGETQYMINLLPFGGYVKMAGEGEYLEEDGKEKAAAQNPRGFEVQAWWKKLIVIVAGVCMNFVLACLIYTIFLAHYSFFQYIPQVVPNQFPFGHVTSGVEFQADPTDPTSPINKVHLTNAYIFNTIDGMPITTLEQVADIVGKDKGKPITINFSDTNGTKQKPITLTPRVNPPKGRGSIGIILSPVSKISFTGVQEPVSGVLYSMDMLQYNVSALVTLVREAVKTHTASYVTSNITGPVGIYEVTGAVYQEAGISGIINIIALLSLALALMNILPIPPLDGGYAFIIIIEAIARKPLSARIKTWIGNAGIAIFILLFIFVTFNDVNNFNILGQIQHLFHH